MALEVFSSVRYYLSPEEISIDNWIFKLHYQFSTAIWLGSSAIGVAKQYFGDPINCQTTDGVNSKVMDDYCWIHSTFHIRSEYQGNVGCILDNVLAGRDSILLAAADTPDTAFYQWVPFTLVFQALLFYVPRWLWKSFEGGLMETFGKDAKRGILLDEECQLDIESAFYRETVAKKYASLFHSTLHHNTGYFLQYLICEVLNFMADILNLYITDVFLGGRFMRYGTQVIYYYSHSPSLRRDMPNPMCTVFPTVTSCTFHSVGTAAGEQKFNSLCVLSLNIINEKIYILLWFWLFFISGITAVHLVYRLLTIMMPYSRAVLLVLRARMFKTSDLNIVKKILTYCYLGDWWVLYQLGRNSNTHFFRYLLRHIEHDFALKEKRALREERRRHRRPPVNGEVGSDDSDDELNVEDANLSIVGSSGTQNGSSGRRRHHKIAMAYNA